eukprot:TRINITY_DN2216_c0_g1_i2.p4 TRINITY_DN2216_c0_g1~~TRINITY_DN2216_c0_g1_i2.p4  ORF type:complete len:105 (+),score=13.01 TRINITY_DN2216_c0_g1_i2:334-648(+)
MVVAAARGMLSASWRVLPMTRGAVAACRGWWRRVRARVDAAHDGRRDGAADRVVGGEERQRIFADEEGHLHAQHEMEGNVLQGHGEKDKEETGHHVSLPEVKTQ